jgi:hypothetical protein
MRPGRISKRDRQAEKLRQKRLQAAPAGAASAKMPPKAIIPDSARRSRPSMGFEGAVGAVPESLPPAHYPVKRVQQGKPQTAGDR